jgi:hypothetical protein
MALVLAPVAAPLARAVAEEPWKIVPEDSLRDLRGGMDLGDLVASFAIQRVVEIDGVVVARMQLVISNLDRLAKGGMPTITVTGPIAQIVQFMKTAGNVSVAGSNTGIPASVASLPTTQSAGAAAGAAASAPASTGPSVASTGNSGTVSATGTQSGSMAQMGSALTQAVTTAANATAQTSGAPAAASPSTAGSVPNTAGSLANTASSAANAPAIAASNTHLQASATPAVSAQPVSTNAVPANTTKTIPVGTTGQAVVLSNLPNAAALTTAVQNEVHAATIQTQTTISATINSMPALNAISLSNSIRAAVSGGG